jgi:hypothetical protein
VGGVRVVAGLVRFLSISVAAMKSCRLKYPAGVAGTGAGRVAEELEFTFVTVVVVTDVVFVVPNRKRSRSCFFSSLFEFKAFNVTAEIGPSVGKL